MAILNIKLAGIEFTNPIMTASGTFGYGKEYSQFYPLSKLGAVMVKGISPKPVNGNPVPRICETSCGMLNAIGLQNPGVDSFINDENYLPFLRKSDTKIIVNIWGKSVEDYIYVAERLNEVKGVDALEINISCPNIKEGGIAFGTDLKQASFVVSEIRKVTKLPLITKLSPNVTKISDFAKAVVDSGTDMISMINTLTGMAIDIETRRPKLANITGGLSGPAIKPIAVKMIHDVYKAVTVPIIGMGGVFTYADAVEMMLAGASAVAVGTANFANPYAPIEILEGLKSYMKKHNIKHASELVGAVNY